MRTHLIRSIGLLSTRLLAVSLLGMAAIAPASVHQERYYYEASAFNFYANGYPGERKDGAGDVPQSVGVEGAAAYASASRGGTVYAGAEVHPIDPFDLYYQTSASAQGYLAYNVWIDGPDPDAFIPVRFQGEGQVSVNSNQALGEVMLRFGSTDDNMILEQWYARGSLGIDQIEGIFQVVAGFEADRVFFLQPKKTYYVEMSAGAGVGASSKNAHAEAMVDPVFTILDGFAANYRIMGVPGGETTPPTGPVPEPATWAMMIAGFAIVGASLRRGHKVGVLIRA